MSDDIEARLRDSFRDAPLPGAPESMREYLAGLRYGPRAARRDLLSWLWVFLIAVAALLVVVIAVGGGSSAPLPPLSSDWTLTAVSPSTTVAPVQTTVDRLAVQTVSELLASRAAGEARGGPFALRGYWTTRYSLHSCVPPGGGQPGDLEIWCHDGEWGITERDEPIRFVDQTGRVKPAEGPHLTPWIASTDARERLGTLPRPNWTPVPIVVVGHFDDALAADCRPEARQECLDRFVIDRIDMFDPSSVPAPTPSPTPTSFPISYPPPPLLTEELCYPGVAKSLMGWTTIADLDIPLDRFRSRQGQYVYAMVTRDVVPLGDPSGEDQWYDNPDYPGHKTRWWGRGVCLTAEAGIQEGSAVIGTTFLEVDDGRHIVAPYPY